MDSSNTMTTGNYNYWPYDNITWPQQMPTVWYHAVTPVECSGDVHVFPCPHCEKCKCGKATVKRPKARNQA